MEYIVKIPNSGTPCNQWVSHSNIINYIIIYIGKRKNENAREREREGRGHGVTSRGGRKRGNRFMR